MCLWYVYVIRQGPNKYPSCALTWIRTSLVQCTPRGYVGGSNRFHVRVSWCVCRPMGPMPQASTLIFLAHEWCINELPQCKTIRMDMCLCIIFCFAHLGVWRWCCRASVVGAPLHRIYAYMYLCVGCGVRSSQKLAPTSVCWDDESTNGCAAVRAEMCASCT